MNVPKQPYLKQNSLKSVYSHYLGLFRYLQDILATHSYAVFHKVNLCCFRRICSSKLNVVKLYGYILCPVQHTFCTPCTSNIPLLFIDILQSAERIIVEQKLALL